MVSTTPRQMGLGCKRLAEQAEEQTNLAAVLHWLLLQTPAWVPVNRKKTLPPRLLLLSASIYGNKEVH